MKKFIAIFSLFFFLSSGINIIPAVAESISLSQGFYNVKTSKLSVGISYTVQNTSTTDKCIVILIDSDQMIQELIRLEPQSHKYSLKPIQQGYTLVVVGNGNLVFS